MSTGRPVDDYLASLDGARRERIAALYARAAELAPDAVQATKYAMPCLAVGGKGLIAVMSTRAHTGIYPFSGVTVGSHAQQLADLGIPTTKGAIRLPDDVELPDDLFAAVVTTRLAEILG